MCPSSRTSSRCKRRKEERSSNDSKSSRRSQALLRSVALAAELIDLRRHSGQHPRLGATDVLPFVPVRGVTMDECVALAHEAGGRIWKELAIPVYFYERAALRPDRLNLEDVRRKGFEQLRDEIGSTAERAPDIGEA